MSNKKKRQDIDDQYILFEKNQDLGYHFLHKYYPIHATNPDMQQVVMLGLWKACLKFDPSRGLKLSTFAYRCMRNELLMYLRKDDMSRQIKANVTVLSINAEMEGGDSFEEILGSGDFTNAVDEKIDLERMLDSLPNRQKRMLIMRNIDDMSQQQIGVLEKCSRSRVSRLITTAREQLNQEYNQDLTRIQSESDQEEKGETEHDGNSNPE